MDSCKSTSFDTVGLPTWKQMTWWGCCYFFSGAVQQPTGPHCFLLQVQIFFCSSLTPRRTSKWCTGVYLLCGQQTYRLAGHCQGGWDRRDRASPFRFLWGWGPGGWGLVSPLLSRSLPAPICSGQLLSDLSSFPIFLSTPHFATLSSVLSPTSCSLLLLPGLQPSTSLLGPAVCGAPCPLPRLWSQALCPLGSRLVSTQIPTGIAKTAALHWRHLRLRQML